jgi:ribonuclease HI
MYFDSSLMCTGAGAGVILVSHLEDQLRYAIRLHFTASNNLAEYEALIHGLWIASNLGMRRIYVRGDSKLVVDQVMKERRAGTTRWLPTAMRSASWRRDLTASSSTTSSGMIMKLPAS